MRRSFFLKRAPNHGKRYGELPKSDTLQYLEIQLIYFIHVCLQSLELFLFSTCSPVPKRYPKRYLSDTLLVHKSSQIHPVPSNQKERKSRPKRRQKTGIESPNGHEHGQLQFNLIYISESFITIS